MIELDDFIAEALISVVGGIKKGQDSAEFGEYVAPLIQGKERNTHGNFHLKNDQSNQATILQFDVQVTTETERAGNANVKGKFKLLVVDMEIGGGGGLSIKASNLHRLQFAIPVKIPKRDVATSLPAR